MEDILNETLAKGVELHVAGQFDLASQLYSTVIKLKPNHADANHNMGLLKLDMGHDLEALPYLQTALQEDTSIAQFWISYIKALIKLDKTKEAGRILVLAQESGFEDEAFLALYRKLDEINNVSTASKPQEKVVTQAEPNVLDTLKLDQAFKLAIKNTKEGLPEEAKRIYQDILAKFPKNKRAQQALDALTNPLENLIIQLINLYEQGQFSAAVEHGSKILQTYPQAFEVWNILGVLFRSQGKLENALAAFNNALYIKPNYCEAFNNKGITLQDQGKFEESIVAFKEALSIRPKFAEAFYNKGNSLHRQNLFDEAIQAYEKVLKIEPNNAKAFNNMGLALKEKGCLAESIEAYNKALSIKPDYAEALNNKGVSLQYQGELDEAMKAFNKALSLKLDYAEAYNNMGLALQDQGKLDEAREAYHEALSLNPDFADAYHNLGNLFLLQQNFTQAFELMEWRWKKSCLSIGSPLNSSKPSWDGKNKKKIFVWAEQGIGDEIMFGSLLPEARRSSEKLIVECDKRLIPLYKRSFSQGIKFIDDKDKISEDLYENHIPIGSLAKHFRQKLDDFTITSSGWLKADQQKTISLRNSLSTQQNDKIIGISWFTKSTNARNNSRNIPLEYLANTLKKIPANYVNLQYGETIEEISKVKQNFGLEVTQIEGLDLFNDLDGLAALISACDVVISIDNATVHLAGALGVETKVLLPFAPDERWGIMQSDSYWYDSLTLYRQETHGDWQKPLEKLMQNVVNACRL